MGALKIDYREIETLRAAIRPDFTSWSNEVEVTQAMIDDFARLSGDDYWIHTDPKRAKREKPVRRHRGARHAGAVAGRAVSDENAVRGHRFPQHGETTVGPAALSGPGACRQPHPWPLPVYPR